MDAEGLGRERTVEEMLGEGVVWHVLGDEQPLVTLGAAANKVDEALVAHLPHARRLRLQRQPHCITVRDPGGGIEPSENKQPTRNRTRNCCGSGQERREKRLTAMRRPPSSRPR